MTVLMELEALLEECRVDPVLVDVGASGGAPEVWKPLVRHATYVGFDPDLREMRRDTGLGYRSALIINKAVCADPGASTVAFYLTESPYCSSMLRPDAKALSKYSFWQLFRSTREVRVAATTLNDVMREQGLGQIDWLKIDAQGADLRIYMSLAESVRRKVLAVDTEPGLLDAYEGEDLFTDVHGRMRAEGFWLSRLNVMGVPRISAEVLGELRIRTHDGRPVGIALRSTPGWCEARYLRTAESLRAAGCGQREFVLSWAFALIDEQYGHALELAAAARDSLADHALAERLWSIATRRVREVPASRPDAAPTLWHRMRRRLTRRA